MKPYIIPGLILIILVLCFGWLRSCEKAKEVVQVTDNTAFRTIIDNLKQDTTDLRTQLRQKATQMTQDSTRSAKVITGLQVKINVLRAKEPALRAEVQPLIDSLPKLKAFVENQDSVIAEQVNMMSNLNAAYGIQVKSLNEQLALNEKIQAKSDEIAKAYESRVADVEKSLRKENRRKRFWRSATLVMTGGLAAALLLNQ